MASIVANRVYASLNSISRREMLLFCVLFSIISLSNCADDSNLPLCQTGASCGFVQLNRNGVNFQEHCRCQDGEVCPFGYGFDDGQSIRHGMDEWKYCKQAPTLPNCGEGDVVYEHMVSYYEDTGEKVLNDHSILCHCPHASKFVFNRTLEFESTSPCGTSKLVHILTRHACTKLPRCRAKDTCRVITESHSQNGVFYDDKCTCEWGFCPSDYQKAYGKFPGKKGTAYLFRCS